MPLSSLGDPGWLALDAFSDYVIHSALQVSCEGVCVWTCMVGPMSINFVTYLFLGKAFLSRSLLFHCVVV